MQARVVVLGCSLLVAGQASCVRETVPPTPVGAVEVAEVTPQWLTLPAEWAAAEAEYSGLAWWGDALVILPQYPERLGGRIPTVTTSALTAGLEGAPLDVQPLQLVGAEWASELPGFEGFEAIAFEGTTALLTIETQRGGTMGGWAVRGEVDAAARTLTLDATCRVELPMPMQQDNKSWEAAVRLDDRWLLLFEVNDGQGFGLTLDDACALAQVPVPALPFRLTDAEVVEGSGASSWLAVLNYQYPGDDELQNDDAEVRGRWGVGASHRAEPQVERIVFWAPTDAGWAMAERAPIWLSLQAGAPRNWEGLVAWETGFVLVTDKFPETLLGVVR